MIESIKDKSLKLLYEKGDKSKVWPDLIRKIENILSRLDAAIEIKDMGTPGLKLLKLKGERKGVWSVTIKSNRRITFRMENDKVYDVNLEDYH